MPASRDLANLGDTFSGVSNVNIDSNTLFVDTTNNRVGIGTSSPSGGLHINGGSYESLTISGTSNNSVGLRIQNSRNYNIGVSGNSGPTSNGSLFIYDDTAGIARVNISSLGDVAIGSVPPIRRLSVDGGEVAIYGQAGGAAFINVSNTSGGAGNTFTLYFRGLSSNGSAGVSLNGVYIDSSNTYINGRISTLTQSQSASVSGATAITVATATPTTIASISLTTTGKKVLIVATGDGNPNQTQGWHILRLYRNEDALGKFIINENAGGISCNCPFALCHIDQPAAGTYTYSVRAWQGSGSFTYGESGDVQAPTIFAVEII